MPPPILHIHAAGNWPQRALVIHRTASTWHAPPDVQAHIESAWLDATTRPGVNLFDGPMCRLESWRATPDRLELTLSDTTYKRFLGTNLTRPDFADTCGPNILANPVGVSPALLTADGFVMMGRRNASVAYYPDRIHPFAGALDPADADPFIAVRRELREELSFADTDVDDVRCTGIAEDLAIRQPELIFLARSTRTRAQVEAALDQTEHHGAWSTPATPSAIEQVLSNWRAPASDRFTPVALASLLLYGRLEFGEDFYQQRAPSLIA